MTYCSACGHALGTSRFCTRCGRPADEVVEFEHQHTDTAERPAVRPQSPAPVEAPTANTYAARFPLYADEVTEATVETPAPRTATPPARSPQRPRVAWPLFALVALGVAALLGVGFWLLGADDSSTADPGGSSTGTGSGTGDGTDTGDGGSTAPATAPQDPVELAGSSRAEAPVTAPPNLDVHGARVRYDAANMLDNTPKTAWRMPGDGTGQTLTFTLPGDVVLTEVGLINGYAKLDRAGRQVVSWYERNRRVLSVRWTFDDGTSVEQRLARTRAMQTRKVEPIRTGSVRLTLLKVSAPAARNGRNYTPISDVTFIGG